MRSPILLKNHIKRPFTRKERQVGKVYPNPLSCRSFDPRGGFFFGGNAKARLIGDRTPTRAGNAIHEFCQSTAGIARLGLLPAFFSSRNFFGRYIHSDT